MRALRNAVPPPRQDRARAGPARRWPRRALRGAQAVAVRAVVGAVRAQADGERRVAACLEPAAGLLERAAEAEVREVVHGRALDDRGELVARGGVAAGAEVRAAERLADRGL